MLARRTLLAATAAMALFLSAPTNAAAEGPLKVVATFSVLGDMVARIGGEHVSLTTLVGPNGDTHVYQPVPTAARAVAEADVLVLNGLGFEGWIERLEESAGFSGARVVATTGVDALAYEDGDHGEDEHEEHGDHGDDHHDDHDDHAKHDDEHGDHDDHAKQDDHHDEHSDHEDHDEHEDHAGHDHHDHGAFDPHAWHKPAHAVIYVDNITAALAKADPQNAGVYYQNRAAYVAEIEALDAEINAMLSALPEAARTVVTSHDAFGYFADAYDLTFEAPQGLSTESEASAADVAALIRQIRKEGIKAVFVDNVSDERLLKQIANETGAVIGGSLYSDALSEADGPAGTYLDMLRHNARTLAEALSS